MINFNSINKSLMKNMGSALVNMAMIASPLSTGAATNAYYAARKANYGRNNSYLIDEGLNSLRTGRWSNNLASKKDRTNIETASSADDLVLRKNVAVRELVVVDSHIKNRELFSKLIRPGVELVRIDGNSNGFDVLMNKLGAYEELDAIHLFAHGQQGQILLGNQLVAKTTIETSVQAFSRFNQTLKEGGELRVYNSELDNINTVYENLEISKEAVAKPSASKISINSEDLSINKGDINAYPEEGSIARMDLSDVWHATTFNWESGYSGLGTNTATQMIDGETLQVTSTTLGVYSASNVVGGGYSGSEGIVSHYFASEYETKWRFSLVSGKSFDLTSIELYETSNFAQTLTFTSSKGTTTIAFTGQDSQTFDVSANANASNFQGITYFEITGDYSYGGKDVFTIVADNIILDNITAANSAPVIGGTSAGQTVNDNATISPFSAITVTDGDGDNVSATITLDAAAKGTLSGTGLTADGGGVYSISSTTVADLQSKLRALVFTPTQNRSATSETTTFTVEVSDGTDSDSDNTTTVISNAVGPTISAVSIPNSSMNVGDVVTATITVSSDTDNYTSGSGGISGTIGGFSLGNLSRTNATTYTATFTVTEGGTDVAAGSNIPVSITLTDSGGKGGNTYTTPISQGSDAIDANSPTISNVSIPNTPYKVGDAISVTITAGETGLSLNSGTVNGVAVTGFTDNSDNTYSATYTVVEGNTDRAAGANIPVSFILSDAAGNSSSTFTTAISQGSDAIDANSPTISSVNIPNSPAKVGDVITVTITAGETGLSLNSGTVNGVAVTGFTDNSDNTYSATYTVVEGNTD
ncbi:MAG: DUF4347 domain-containing protein, partial [Cytophagia bacterium]|nr:DUF4347 domain-containing protein [Cytophagia bacterium]